jgi:regulator of nonsense transcripts 2
MVRKKRVQHLDGRQRSLVENALYYANPPETPQIVHASLPPMLQYIQKLLYKDLNKINTERVRTCILQSVFTSKLDNCC